MVRTPSGEWRNLHGRRRGKALKPAQKQALADLPGLALHGVRPDENPGRVPLDLAGLAAGRAVWLEIGFGGGEHLVHQAARHPEVLMLGCEPFVNGVAKLLVALRAAAVDNVRLHPGDVRELFDVLPPAGLERVFLLYPDPWPKTRHHARRFVTPQYLEPLARAMAPGAILRIATDIPDYVRQTDAEVPRAGFDDLRPAPEARARPWDDWLPTRYERKALREGRVPAYLEFRRHA
ncbi:MAG: tRNA (guanosine(46)-N7)-methyltransferase TrmB [Rhodobacteraceae bacterium]|nr:tRNA (guanosine(46)-N7)-methyltransferase TrmB [Paracoccaceae bacterium]